MREETSIFLPSPPVGEGGASRSEATGEGFLQLGKLYENVLQHDRGLLQHIIVPVTRDTESLGNQYGFSRIITLGFHMLTTIDFDDEAPFEANKVEYEALKGDLPTKFEGRQSAIP